MNFKTTLRNVAALAVTVTAAQLAFANGPIDYGFGGAAVAARDANRAKVAAELGVGKPVSNPENDKGYVTLGELGYVFRDAPSTRTRAEVVAELREAIRIGAYVAGESGLPVATPEQEALIYAAGRRAAMEAAAGTR